MSYTLDNYFNQNLRALPPKWESKKWEPKIWESPNLQHWETKRREIEELKKKLETFNHDQVISHVEAIFKSLAETNNWREAIRQIILLTQEHPDFARLITSEAIKHMEALDLTELVMGALKS